MSLPLFLAMTAIAVYLVIALNLAISSIKAEKERCEELKKHAEKFLSHVMALKQPRPLDEWNEDYGDVLWWKFPIEEPPYVGSPLDEKWPGYHTHWTLLDVPEPPKEE